MVKNKLSVFTAVSIMLLVLTAGVIAKGNIEVSLKSAKTAFSEKDNVSVDVTISNTGKRAVRLLKWFTPIAGMEEPLFNVSIDGKKVEFVGPHYKRPEPTERDFYVLRGGKSITSTVDLSEFYDFSASGDYEIVYDASTLGRSNQESVDFVEMRSDSLNMFVSGRAVKTPPPVYPDAVSGSTAFARCTTSQQAGAATARNDASTYANNALSYLTAGSAGLRYTTWFGTYNTSRYNTVKNNFTNIASAMDTAPMTINCGCKKTYYAYVYSNQPYTVYVCKAFWTAPATGTDSKAGTLVHEMSHFTVVAGTDDWVYGQTGARNLAITNPTNAVDNADSHEYFAENTPFQN